MWLASIRCFVTLSMILEMCGCWLNHGLDVGLETSSDRVTGPGSWIREAEWLSQLGQIWSPAEYRAPASALASVRSIWSLGHQNEIRLYHRLGKKSKVCGIWPYTFRGSLLNKYRAKKSEILSHQAMNQMMAVVRMGLGTEHSQLRCPQPQRPWRDPTRATEIIETWRNTRNYNEPG